MSFRDLCSKLSHCLMRQHEGEPALRSREPASHLAVLLVLILGLNLVAACGTGPTPAAVAVVESPTSPAPRPSATPAALPTVPAAPRATASQPPTVEPTLTPSSTPTHTATATSTPTLTPTLTATLTPSPSPTGTPTPALVVTITVTGTAQGPGAIITVTQTSAPSPTPTLTPTPMYTPTPIPTVAVSDDVVHILLIGLDSKRNLWAQNTDVLIVAAINKDTKQVSLLSIPRDLWVYIPTYGWGRINMAHRKGFSNEYPGQGPGLLKDTIEMNLGVPVDHWVRVDFQGFKRVVDELGGVEMTVACPVNLRYRPPGSGDTDQEEQILQPGVYPMDGETALKYVRTRRGGSDFDRARRQHQFLKALWDQATSPDLLLKIPGLWSALSDSFETDLQVGDVLALAPMALELRPDRIRSRYIGPNHTIDWTTHLGWRVLLPRLDRIRDLVASLYAPPSQTGNEITNEGARVQVRNGTYRQQLGLIAADQLQWQGIKVLDTAPAETPDYAQTQIVVYNDKPKTVELLSEQLDVEQENILYQPDPNQPADILVILGDDYDPCR